MTAPLFDDYAIFRDKNAGAGAAPFSVLASMVPAGFAAPSSVTIASGNGAGQWAISAGVIDAAGASVTPGTYTLGVTANFSYAAPDNTATRTLTIIVPTDTYYVDPATGSDSNAGTSKGSPWAHAPGQPGATGVPAALTDPGHLVLVVIKGGTFARIASNLAPPFLNLTYAGGAEVGWGSGSTTYCGATQLGAGSAPSSGDVSGNPNFASMKKWTLGAARGFGQYLIDRDNASVVQVAQWPAAGPDVWINGADPTLAVANPAAATGMATIPMTDVTFAGAASTIKWPAALKTLMNGHSLAGYWISYWTISNTLDYVPITADNLTTGTFDASGMSLGPIGGSVYAFQVVGHPLLITAAGQFAWSTDNLTVYAWTVSPSNIEIMGIGYGLVGDAINGARVTGLTFDGFGSDLSTGGSAISVNANATKTLDAINNTIRWCAGGNQRCAGILYGGVGNVTDARAFGNHIYEMIRGGGIRCSLGSANVLRGQYNRNLLEHLQGTAIYLIQAQSTICNANSLLNIGSIHGNGATFYNDNGTGFGIVVQNNRSRNVVRPLTKDQSVGAVFDNNLFECDSSDKDALRDYASDGTELWTRCAFLRSRDNPTSTGAFIPPSGTNKTGTLNKCVIDGMPNSAGVAALTVTNSLAASLGSYHFENNTGGNTGNSAAIDQTTWNGTLRGEMMRSLGKGRIADQMIQAWTVIGDITHHLTDLIGVGTGSSQDTGSVWLAVDTEGGSKTITVTNGTIDVANDSAGGGATGSPASSKTVASGKFVKIFTTASPFNLTKTTVTIDPGDGSAPYLWNVTTAKAISWPLLAGLDAADIWKQATSSFVSEGNSNTQFMTLVVPFGVLSTIDTTGGGTIFGYRAGQLISLSLQIISATKKLRGVLKNAANAVICQFDTAAVPQTSAFDLVVTVDMTKAAGGSSPAVDADGIQCWFYTWNAAIGSQWARQTCSSITWSSGGTIGWGQAGTSNTLELGAQTGVISFGGIFVWDVLADLSTAAKREVFHPLQLGFGGLQNPLGTAPIIAMVGDLNWWTDTTAQTTGVNRGSKNLFKVQAGGSVTAAAGAATTWPSYTYATDVTLSGPTVPTAGVASTYTVNFDNPIGQAKTVSLSDGGAGGAFTPSSLSFVPGDENTPQPASQTFTYTPAAAGLVTLSAAASGLVTGTLALDVQAPAATAYAITGANSTLVGTPVALTFTLNGNNPVRTKIALTLSGASATADVNPVILEIGQTVGVANITPTAAGTVTVTAADDQGLTDPAPFDISAISTGGPSVGVFQTVFDPTRGKAGKRR